MDKTMKQTTLPRGLTSLLIGILGLGLISCGTDANQASSFQIPLKIQKATSTQASKAKSNMVQQVDTLVLTNVKFLVDEFELGRVDDDSLDFEMEDFVVNLPLDGSELLITNQMVPEGTYEEFEFEVSDADDNSNIQDPDLVQGTADSLRYSAVVKGTFNGENFTYNSQSEFELNFEIIPNLVVSETSTPAALMILVGTSSWFIDSETGAVLNPNLAENRSKIDRNMRRSFEAREAEGNENDEL